MCGFVGVWSKEPFVDVDEKLLYEMGEIISNRGPDSWGIWNHDNGEVAFCHRRLSIVELSEAGSQPMVSESGRYIIAFNGEIYNHEELRVEVDINRKVNWRGTSDTETLLKAIEIWGVPLTLKKLIGMFSFSLWDMEEDALYLARDRFGEKPLYFYDFDNIFIFGSELKSFRIHPKFKPIISREALRKFLSYGYVPAPYCIYKGVKKLSPGTYLKKERDRAEIISYWNPSVSFLKKERTGTISTLEKRIKKSIKQQMVAEVPLGAFLSGGVDSSLIVALMQEQSDVPVKTFSIGFDENGYDEAVFAKKVAHHLGTDHTELYVTPDHAMEVIDRLPDIFDEPFGDSSQIPTFLVSKLAKDKVTVVLSGDGGDELFCGYNRYAMTSQLWGKISHLPIFIRKIASKIMLSISAKSWEFVNYILPSRFKMSNVGQKIHKAARVITSGSTSDLYDRLISHYYISDDIVLDTEKTSFTEKDQEEKIENHIERMMALDTMNYLADDILVKVDRSTMANSLEARVPFLDHSVFEYAWNMPFESKLNKGMTKYCLREILYKYVPKELIERPKAGFAVPIDEWLRGPLREWAGELLDESRIVSDGFLDPKAVRKMWCEHVSRKKDWHHQLWNILMFQAWYERHHR